MADYDFSLTITCQYIYGWLLILVYVHNYKMMLIKFNTGKLLSLVAGQQIYSGIKTVQKWTKPPDLMQRVIFFMVFHYVIWQDVRNAIIDQSIVVCLTTKPFNSALLSSVCKVKFVLFLIYTWLCIFNFFQSMVLCLREGMDNFKDKFADKFLTYYQGTQP